MDTSSQSQPSHSPQQTSVHSYNLTIVAIIVSLIIGFIGGYFMGTMRNGESDVADAKGIPATTMNTINWKTYTSTNQQFSFKYPEVLLYAHTTYVNDTPDENIPHFFTNQQEIDAALNCVVKKEATLQTPCDAGLFDVADVTNSEEVTKQPIDIYRDTTDPNLPKTVDHTDSQGRKWTILGPTFILGGTQTDAQLKINDKTYQVQIHVWDRFVNSSQQGAAEAQITFIKQILDTFTFSY